MDNDEMMRKQVPLHFGPLRNADGNARQTGSCGDTVEFWISILDGQVNQVSFTSDGCDHSLAAGAMVSFMVEQMPIEVVKKLSFEDVISELEDFPESSYHCVTLALTVMNQALSVAEVSYAKKEKVTSSSISFDTHSAVQERRTIMVISGKGGVGKSTVSVNLAVCLALQGYKVGLVDVDVHGPSIPTMLNLHGIQIMQGADGIQPVLMPEMNNLEVMSLGFLLQHEDDPVVWRGPLKNSLIQQFLHEVAWGPLDYLIVDCPPGTGDEPLSVAQQLASKGEALLVTTPQDVATADVSRSINFCKQLTLPVVGIIENMSGFACPHCHKSTYIFRSGGGSRLAMNYHIPFLGAIPIETSIGVSGDAGTPYVQRFPDSPVAQKYQEIASTIHNTRSTEL